jgi:succinate dehydrogenase / fumarate reductase, cytochrome b subunit
MNWLTATLTSSIGKKLVMSLTGLFLCSFLVIHLFGNILALLPDEGKTFNAFTTFMENNLLIRTLEILLFAGFIIHIWQAWVITRHNAGTRPVKYEVSRANENSKWYSRNMGILGSLILVFLVIHLKGFFWEIRFGHEVQTDADGTINLYPEVVQTFQYLPYTLLYVAAMFALGYHLLHGFQSAFRSLGIMHKKYTPIIRGTGVVYTYVITGGFIIIPIVIYIKQFLH